MTQATFIENYMAGGFTDAAKGKLRQEAAKSLPKSLNPTQIADLCELYFGFRTKGRESEWFFAPFTQSDDTFSRINNDREIAILAGCYIDQLPSTSAREAKHAIISTAFLGQRLPLFSPERIQILDQALRSGLMLSAVLSKPLDTQAATLIADGQPIDQKTINTALKSAIDATSAVATSVTALREGASQSLAQVQRQISTVSWYLGGFSPTAAQRRKALSDDACAFWSAQDLGGLWAGHAVDEATEALLQAANAASKKAVGAFAKTLAKDAAIVREVEALRDLPLVAPLHALIRAALRKETDQFLADAKLTTQPLGYADLATQLFRERRLIGKQ